MNGSVPTALRASVKIRTLVSCVETTRWNRTPALHLTKDHDAAKTARANTKVQNEGSQVMNVEVLGWVMEHAHAQ